MAAQHKKRRYRDWCLIITIRIFTNAFVVLCLAVGAGIIYGAVYAVSGPHARQYREYLCLYECSGNYDGGVSASCVHEQIKQPIHKEYQSVLNSLQYF